MARRPYKGGGYSSSWIRPTTRLALYLRDGLCCVYCLQDWSVNGLTLDHVVDRTDGGNNDPTNLVSSCMRCNALKRQRGWQGFAEALDISPSWLKRRIQEQATPLTTHLRRRARHLRKFRPPWLKELLELNKNWSPQQPLFDLPKKIVPMVHVEQPPEEDEVDPLPAVPDDSEIPF